MTRAWRARGRLRGGMLPGQVSPPVGCVGLRSCIGAGSTTPSPPFGGSRPRRTPALMHEIAKTQSTTSLLDCCYHSLPSHSCPSYWFCLGASAPRLPSWRLEDPQLVGACPPGVSRMCMLNPLGSAKKTVPPHPLATCNIVGEASVVERPGCSPTARLRRAAMDSDDDGAARDAESSPERAPEAPVPEPAAVAVLRTTVRLVSRVTAPAPTRSAARTTVAAR